MTSGTAPPNVNPITLRRKCRDGRRQSVNYSLGYTALVQYRVMSSHRCSAPFCEEPADPAVAFCFRHSAMVPEGDLEEVNRAWREMNRSRSGAQQTSAFYKARQRAIDAAGAGMLSKSDEDDSSGRFAKLLGRLASLGKSAPADYKGDIASVSRAQDDTFVRNAEQRAWNAKKRTEPPGPSN